MLNKDYKDILSALLGHKAEFILVGACAMAAHGYPRATMDIDILTSISGVEFPEAYEEAIKIDIDGQVIPVLSVQHLIQNKKCTGRSRDIDDAEILSRLGD